ncbi:MAG: hypothetical protein WC796_02700 [Candidatus Pacearchaeota archaeon]|jgi:hypothetical protein
MSKQIKAEGPAPIYSMIEHDVAISAKKKLLMAEINILNSLACLQRYGDLRKKEMMLKIKLKNDLTDIKNHITKIIENNPKTEGIKKVIHIKHFHTHHEVHRHNELGDQLADIQDRINALG